MSNCEQHVIASVDVDVQHIKEVLHCLLHTIMFNRALGVVRPREVTSSVFDLTWVDCNDPKVDRYFDDKINKFEEDVAVALVTEAQPLIVQLSLNFFETLEEKGFLKNTIRKLNWEQWAINLSISHVTDRQSGTGDQHGTLAQHLRDRMMYILQTVDAKKDHLPKIGGAVAKNTVGEHLGVTYEYEIVLPESKPQSLWDLGKEMAKLVGSTPLPT
jgi:autophagy-related protein 101